MQKQIDIKQGRFREFNGAFNHTLLEGKFVRLFEKTMPSGDIWIGFAFKNTNDDTIYDFVLNVPLKSYYCTELSLNLNKNKKYILQLYKFLDKDKMRIAEIKNNRIDADLSTKENLQKFYIDCYEIVKSQF